MDHQSPSNPGKSRLRRSLLAARKDIPPEQRSLADGRICAHVVEAVGKHNARVVAGYQAVNGEPDIGPALLELHRLGYTICLPVIDPENAGEMEFRQWSPGSPLRRNRFGIPEPTGTHPVPLEDIDLVLTPLVAYSADGHRIGMGGGYYDRIFATPGERTTMLRYGIAYSLQEIESAGADPWDIALHAVINEAGRFTFNR